MDFASLKIVLKLCTGVIFVVRIIVMHCIPQSLYQHVSHRIDPDHTTEDFFCNYCSTVKSNIPLTNYEVIHRSEHLIIAPTIQTNIAVTHASMNRPSCVL